MKLILLPGMDGTGDLFAPFLRALGNSIETRVVRYPADEPLGYMQLLPRVRAELPRSGQFVLLGESFSGPLAIMLAAEAPIGLAGVVLCASFATNPIKWLPRCSAALVRPICFCRMPRFAQIKALLGRYATPELCRILRNANSAVNPCVLATRARAILEVDVSAEFRTCTLPVLYLRGMHDRLVRGQVVESLVRENPALRVVTLSAPHLVLQAAPVESARAILDFVASTTDPARSPGPAESRR